MKIFSVPDDYKLNPGSVEAIAEHPLNTDKIIIGYNRGLMVLWDNKSLNSENTYIGNQVSMFLLFVEIVSNFNFCFYVKYTYSN